MDFRRLDRLDGNSRTYIRGIFAKIPIGAAAYKLVYDTFLGAAPYNFVR